MDLDSIHPDTQAVYASRVVLEDGSLITKTGCKIYAPARFEEKGLLNISADIFLVGIFLMVLPDGSAAVSLTNAMMQITPTAFTTVKVNSESYYEFEFAKGATVIKNVELVKDNKLVYKIYNEIFSQGYIPFYLNYHTLASVFDSALKHAGANVGSNQEVTQLVVSIIARDPSDKSRYYREVVHKLSDLNTNPPWFSALRDVMHAPSNTLDKLAGSYMETGVISALNNPSTRTERVEAILRA